MSEFTLDDGRKAETVETKPDSLTKVTEVYVEPKVSKRLSQRVIERFCVCERETQVINEDTGEVVDSVVENLCGFPKDASAVEKPSERAIEKLPMKKAVEKKISTNANRNLYVFAAVIAIQVIALAYVLFFM